MGIQIKEGKCGPYCKHLNSQEQRAIIKNIIRNQARVYGDLEDASYLIANQSAIGYVGERKFIINA